MKREKTGQYITISTVGDEIVKAFVPQPLPPDPPLDIDSELRDLTDQALLSLGRLDSVSTLLPDPYLFLYMHIRKEAVLSSQIEGTQSSLSDLLLFENQLAPGVPIVDVQEVSNYVAAIDHGLKRIQEGFPISLRLIRELHGILLRRGRGSDKEPGEFRMSQNWIGGSRPGNAIYVPPPPDKVPDCMGALERFLHNDPVKVPILTKAALAHAQFETIHPFMDGNGRVGRLLIILLLCAENALALPVLYLSLYFKTYRNDYYDLLQGIRQYGDWENWLKFFMAGVYTTSQKTVLTAQSIVRIFEADEIAIRSLGKSVSSSTRIHDVLKRNPIMSIPKLAEISSLSVPSVTTVLNILQELEIVSELTGKRRNRLFGYSKYLELLNEGTEPA